MLGPWPISPSPNSPAVRVANGQRLQITHIGDAVLEVKASNTPHNHEQITLKNVLVVPNIGPRLFSCGAGFKNDGIKTLLNDDCVLVTPSGRRIEFTDNPVGAAVHCSVAASPTGDPPVMHEPVALTLETDVFVTAMELHQRLGHFGKKCVCFSGGNWRFGVGVHGELGAQWGA